MTTTLQDAERLRDRMVDAVENGTHTARRTVHKARRAVEDAADQARLGVRQRPFATLGMAFLAGVIVAWIATRRRRAPTW